MKRYLCVAFLALAAGALAAIVLACGSGGGTPKLDGTSWKLTGWSVSSQDPSQFTITADFAGGKISGRSAVNTYTGPYTVGPGDAFSVGKLASTMMAGPEADMQAETTYLQLLEAAKSVKVDGTTLTLYDSGGNESLIYAKQ